MRCTTLDIAGQIVKNRIICGQQTTLSYNTGPAPSTSPTSFQACPSLPFSHHTKPPSIHPHKTQKFAISSTRKHTPPSPLTPYLPNHQPQPPAQQPKKHHTSHTILTTLTATYLHHQTPPSPLIQTTPIIPLSASTKKGLPFLSVRSQSKLQHPRHVSTKTLRENITSHTTHQNSKSSVPP